MNLFASEEVGLTTKEAIDRLCKDVEHVLNQFKTSQKIRKSKSWIYDTLHYKSQHTTINCITVTTALLCALVLIVTGICTKEQNHLIQQGLFIFMLLVLSVSLQLYENYLRHNEIPNRIKFLLDRIRNETRNVNWTAEDYPTLLTPFSPCITLQWTYRDNEIVNLPWALLVKDDVVLIRPGQVSPGYCESLDKNTEYPLLHAKEVYGPSLQSHNEIFSTPKVRKPLECKRYRLLETPFVNNLKIALEQALDRPITQQNQQRHLLMVRFVERLFLPVSLVAIFVINIVRWIYLEQMFGRSGKVDLFILVPISTVLPLLSLVFPLVWNVLNYLGMAKFKITFEGTIKSKTEENLHLLEDQDQLDFSREEFTYDWKVVWTYFFDIFLGKEYILNRSSNVLHVLGSVTALCCVDKKGILSWPNPTAEKVFFLHNSNLSDPSSLADLGDLHHDVQSEDTPRHHQSEKPLVTTAEVLDITHDQADPFKLHFDDMKWHEHLNSLKPLGLAILLNTCNIDTQLHYTKFCSHITCEAMYNENLVPVTNRRCLCELANVIGFVDEAQKIFSLEQQLFTFRHLQTEMVRRDNKYARSLSMSTKLKFPFPHMFAVVVKELTSGQMQLLSQGTADVILDSCVDYWDGQDLCPLTPSDRKKIQDFYQRTSLTAYCTAFAYRPLTKSISEKLSNVYLELPSDGKHLYHLHRSPTPVHWDCKSVLEPRTKTPLGHFYSTDSLLCNDCPCTSVCDAEGLFEIQCNQIFIGMVTMQYQALSDMVQLIEQLERACIRFVHFSKENELRSRVFSEKMGLESGWNCHISLLSERNRRESGPTECWANNGTTRVNSPLDLPHLRHWHRYTARSQAFAIGHTNRHSNLQSSRTMSFSAPSAINVDHSTVKFDIDQEHSVVVENKNEHRISVDSVQLGNDVSSIGHEWQSLSCLTDSTEQSAPVNFDMSNRAKLPRGIDKIRPHIELIDNVPLLVSLFTDCTATGTREMLHIMQDYGEVVCVLGSSANAENIGIFMQGDTSIALEPLYPQVCQKAKAVKTIESDTQISPIELSRALNSVPCSLSMKREHSISSIYSFISEARHYTSCLWNSVQFWLCCCITLTIIQILSAFLMLPPVATTGHVMWISYVVVPVLSISLVSMATDPDIMKKPQRKNQTAFNFEVIVFIIWVYGMKFLLVILATFIGFIGILTDDCKKICLAFNCTCKLFYLPMDTENATLLADWSNMEHTPVLYSAQNFSVFIIVINLAVVSMGFVHREHLLWQKLPFTNYIWVLTATVLVMGQFLYSVISEYGNEDSKVPYYFFILALMSPFFTLAVNELIKREEIKVNLRSQRRARLDFGTKLGMNSPF